MGLLSNDGIFTNAATGVIDVNAESGFDADLADEIIASSGTFTNLGEITSIGKISITGGNFDNSGTLDNADGLILVTGGTVTGLEGVENVNPSQIIVSSPTETIFSDIADILFVGEAIELDDIGDEVFPKPEITWTSDLDGILFVGTTFTTDTLSIGDHMITASAVDSEGEGFFTGFQIIVTGDVDGDGVSTDDGDCDDNDINNFPGNTEVDDGQDNNCNVTIDEGFDLDSDGFTPIFGNDCDDTNAAINTDATEVDDGVDNNCIAGVDEGFDLDSDGFTPIGGNDCDDTNAAINTDATEVDDGVDNNCIAGVDEGFDNDGDGVTPIGGNDCDDNDANNFPGNTEVDDGQDNNCDGNVDEGFDAGTDSDGDGVILGDGPNDDCDDNDANNFPGNTEVDDGQDNNCNVTIDEGFDLDSDGFTPIFGNDCDDTNAAINTDATEVDDGVDNNCIAGVDEGFDLDSDGFTPIFGNDCNDSLDVIPGTDPVLTGFDVNPGATEVEDSVDNNCDGMVDEGFSASMDNDADGFTPLQLDCNDGDNTIYPAAPELDDGKDNDCNTLIDDDGVNENIFDLDGDGLSPGYGMDCDDGDLTIYPGATELDDGIDQDCDGVIDNGFDLDGDGFTMFSGDCDDTEAQTNPLATELDDGQDNNCNDDGTGIGVDEGFDLDGDGFTPIGGKDCDDANPLVYLNALEIPDGLDNDCNEEEDDFQNKFTTPELQENLDKKAIKNFEKMNKEFSNENKKLEYVNEKLTEKAERYQEKANNAYENGDTEKGDKYQAKADKLLLGVSSNESLIEINEKQILVIDMSLGNTPVDYYQTIIITYDNLTDKAFNDILDDIKANLREIEKLEEEAQKYEEKVADALDGDTEKAAKYQEKADKALENGNTKKAAKYQEKADKALEGDTKKAAKYQAKADAIREEIEIIEDLNIILKCAINFNTDMLLKEVSFSIKIDRDSDDAEEGNDSDNLLKMKLKSSDLDLVEESEYVGLRFNDIPLEQDQTIISAHIQFTAEDSDKGNADVTIYGHDTGDAPTFTNTDGDISSRDVTGASVAWNIADWKNNYAKTAQQTPDLTSILQEIVDRSDWSDDNSMAFIISDGIGKDRDAYTYDEKSSKAAVLHITTLAIDLGDDHKPHHGHDHDNDDDDDKKGKGHDKHYDKYHDDDDD